MGALKFLIVENDHAIRTLMKDMPVALVRVAGLCREFDRHHIYGWKSRWDADIMEYGK